MRGDLLTRISEVNQKLADNHLPNMLVYATGMFAVTLGVVFFIDAENMAANPTFNFTFEYASPEVWGAIIGATGLLMVFGFWQNRTSGRAPAFILTLLFSILGITAVREPLLNPDGPSLLSASALYTFVAIVSAICIFACSTRDGGRSAQAADDHFDH